MAETFGIIASIAGLVGVLVTVPDIVYSKSKILANIVNELHHCKDHMTMVDMKLQNWKNIWKWSEMREQETTIASQEIYKIFWNPEGFSDVERILKTIRSERKCVDDFFNNKKVKSLMQRSDEQQEMEEPSSERSKLKEELVELRHHTSDKIGDWKVKTVHTNYKGKFLQERVGNIEKTADRLIEFTRYRYWMNLDAGGDASIRPIDPTSLAWTSSVFTGYNDAVKYMETWKRETEEKGEEWRLVLGKPSPEVTLDDLREGLDFDLDFLVKASEQSFVRTVTISPQTECFERVECANNPAIDTAKARNIRKMLTSASNKAILRKQYEAQFRSTASHLVRSTILLHGAPWTRGLCNCGILLVSADSTEVSFCTFMKPRVTDDLCHHPDTEEHRFTRLARALTELCMGETMPYQRFEEPGETRATLLGDVRRRVSREYMKALQSCLDLAEHESNTGFIRPERIISALREIVQP